ncbi:MAG: NAD-dependent epimerase/dehydratase family protein [Acetobacteraceae bacterium]|nr:NAD-dependent epimerase/dehydratase family protein [Acetobacteraceae bacterium]
MATFLVTGGCGFIGSHLCAALAERGHAIRVLDDLSTGSRANLVRGAELVVGDVADPAKAREAMDDVDGCFHLAAIASVERAVRDWGLTHRVNLSGTIALLEAARARRLPVVYASSAAVYGDCPTLPCAEDQPVRPLSAYGADKLGCEQHARVAGAVHGIPTLGLRFFNVFGPRQDPRSPYSGVISVFCDRITRGDGVEVFGDGGQTRDFISVRDVVAALMAGMDRTATEAPVFNVCSGRATSVRDLAFTIGEVCGTVPEVLHRLPRSGEIRHSIGCPRRAREALGLGPAISLRDGLREVIAWMRAGRPLLAHQPIRPVSQPTSSQSMDESTTMTSAAKGQPSLSRRGAVSERGAAW